tara:strand:- start:263 stop:1024 length:762 start_codon:yes stop_codon:yes gene_type:complete
VHGADLDKGLQAFKEGNYKAALKEFSPLAHEGNVEAQFQLGRLYSNDDDMVLRDYAKSRKWYLLAAKAGSSNSAFMVAASYSEGGFGIKTNLKEYKEWFKKALEEKNKYALAHVEKNKSLCSSLNSKGTNRWGDKCFQVFSRGFSYSKKPNSADFRQVSSNKIPKCKGSPITSSANPEWSNCIGTVNYRGHKYVGEWWDGKPHGQGTLTKADGTVQTGTWENGKPPESNQEKETNEPEKNSSIDLKKKTQLVG